MGYCLNVRAYSCVKDRVWMLPYLLRTIPYVYVYVCGEGLECTYVCACVPLVSGLWRGLQATKAHFVCCDLSL